MLQSRNKLFSIVLSLRFMLHLYFMPWHAVQNIINKNIVKWNEIKFNWEETIRIWKAAACPAEEWYFEKVVNVTRRNKWRHYKHNWIRLWWHPYQVGNTFNIHDFIHKEIIQSPRCGWWEKKNNNKTKQTLINKYMIVTDNQMSFYLHSVENLSIIILHQKL